MFIKKAKGCLNKEILKYQKRKSELFKKIYQSRNEENRDDQDLVLYKYNSELNFVNSELERIQKTIKAISSIKTNKKSIGSTVETNEAINLVNTSSSTNFVIVRGDINSDPQNGIISNKSPLAKLLLSKKYGDKVSIFNQGSTIKVKIMPLS